MHPLCSFYRYPLNHFPVPLHRRPQYLNRQFQRTQGRHKRLISIVNKHLEIETLPGQIKILTELKDCLQKKWDHFEQKNQKERQATFKKIEVLPQAADSQPITLTEVNTSLPPPSEFPSQQQDILDISFLHEQESWINENHMKEDLIDAAVTNLINILNTSHEMEEDQMNSITDLPNMNMNILNTSHEMEEDQMNSITDLLNMNMNQIYQDW